MKVEVDGSMGFAGLLRFIVPGHPGHEAGHAADLGRRDDRLAIDLAAAEAEIARLRQDRDIKARD